MAAGSQRYVGTASWNIPKPFAGGFPAEGSHLERYARARDRAHLPAWKTFYERARRGTGAVGIFHETYTVGPGTAESLYFGMPTDFGLAGAVGALQLGGTREAARERLAA